MTEESAEVNQVRLRGRVAAAPIERELPSGDVLWTFRMVVPRPGEVGRSRVDTIDCTVWTARPRRSVRAWEAGDVVEVEGRLRRRFFSVGTSKASRVEVEVGSGRIIRRGGG